MMREMTEYDRNVIRSIHRMFTEEQIAEVLATAECGCPGEWNPPVPLLGHDHAWTYLGPLSGRPRPAGGDWHATPSGDLHTFDSGLDRWTTLHAYRGDA